MFTEEDRQILLDHANTIDSGLMKLAEAIPDKVDLCDLEEAIRYAGERIEHGLCVVAKSIERLARAFETE
jgi:hypothetical protein